ncbi:MAG: STAS domain-containing protein [Thermaerobacterales bacterium]
MTNQNTSTERQPPSTFVDEAATAPLTELLAYLSERRTRVQEEWVQRIIRSQLLNGITREEISTEAAGIYDQYIAALKTGKFEELQDYARNIWEKIIPRGVKTQEIMGVVLLLRDVIARSLFAQHQHDLKKLNQILDAYEPAANHIVTVVAGGFLDERERTIQDQQEAIRELSTPVLQVREGLLISPIIGLIDSQRARQVTEQLLHAIRSHRARVVVIDLTGVAGMDSIVANHLVNAVEAARLVGAKVIVCGLSPEIAQTLVRIGVDLSMMNTVGDLQGGIEAAERVLSRTVGQSAKNSLTK